MQSGDEVDGVYREHIPIETNEVICAVQGMYPK